MGREVHDDPDGPDVDLIGVALAFEDLWGDVIGSAADGLLLLLVVLKTGGQSEVAKLDLHVLVDEEVAEFETGWEVKYSLWMTLFWWR